MVHLRYNEKESNPNPHINFITPLPGGDTEGQDEARQLLRALAAQVRPVMKKHGFSVNSFEEYEYNEVFAGRNWNNGETVEIVLRRANGTFCPTYWLMSTLCHEHMNHGPAFQTLWSRLRTEVRQLQDRGYFGDGFWSSGTRLRDHASVGGDGLETGDLPEYMCGGAQSKARPTATRRRRGGASGKRREVASSLHTGAQTAKKRKAGGRVTSKYAFGGEGAKLADEGDGRGTGFGKRANSKRAREERALAVERRMMALQGGAQDIKPKKEEPDLSQDDTSDDDLEIVPETNAERRQTLLDSQKDDDRDSVKLNGRDAWKQFKDEFNFQAPKTEAGSSSTPWKIENDDDILELFDSEEEPRCDVPVASGSTFTSGNATVPSSSNALNRGKAKASTSYGRGKLVQREINFAKKQTLGVAPVKGGMLAGNLPSTSSASSVASSRMKVKIDIPPSEGYTKNTSRPGIDTKLKREHNSGLNYREAHLSTSSAPSTTPSQGMWNCHVCTLENEVEYLACSACSTPRGERMWKKPSLF